MHTLNLPAYEYKLQKSDDNTFIFDPIRKKYVFLTPEEWVRQHFVHYLTRFLNYPAGLVAIERGTTYNKLQKRTDLCIYNSEGQPLMLVECKASSVQLTAEVVKQAVVYNQTIKAQYLVLTNGLQHYCWQVNFETRQNQPLTTIPDYRQLSV